MALQTAATLGDPLFEGVDTPTGRLRVEILQQKVDFARDAIAAEIGTTLGIAAGFNSLDGD
jgi:predicted lipoprotein